jgi:hypothetical protein
MPKLINSTNFIDYFFNFYKNVEFMDNTVLQLQLYDCRAFIGGVNYQTDKFTIALAGK